MQKKMRGASLAMVGGLPHREPVLCVPRNQQLSKPVALGKPQWGSLHRSLPEAALEVARQLTKSVCWVRFLEVPPAPEGRANSHPLSSGFITKISFFLPTSSTKPLVYSSRCLVCIHPFILSPIHPLIHVFSKCHQTLFGAKDSLKDTVRKKTGNVLFSGSLYSRDGRRTMTKKRHEIDMKV